MLSLSHGQTLVEKIVSQNMGRRVYANELLLVPVNTSLGTDGTAPIAIDVFDSMGMAIVNPDSIILVDDHLTPAKDIASANLHMRIREFAEKHNIRHYYPIGDNGISHVLLPELGLVRPGEIVAGADSHTCTYGGLGVFSIGVGSTDLACVWATGKIWMRVPETIRIVLHGLPKSGVYAKDIILYVIGVVGSSGANYKAVEFHGETIPYLTVSDRLTICNMTAEMGAKAGLIAVDNVTADYYKSMGISVNAMYSDKNAEFSEVIDIDVTSIEPMIACPYSPAKTVKARELVGTRIDQVVIGSCTNGRLEDFRSAHRALRGRSVQKDVKLLILPGSQKVVLQMEEENLLADFFRAGAVLCPPTCGPCAGEHMGVLSSDEIGLYTTNRNYYGRNGDLSAKVYLCNPEIAAYSAIMGSIQIPYDL